MIVPMLRIMGASGDLRWLEKKPTNTMKCLLAILFHIISMQKYRPYISTVYTFRIHVTGIFNVYYICIYYIFTREKSNHPMASSGKLIQRHLSTRRCTSSGSSGFSSSRASTWAFSSMMAWKCQNARGFVKKKHRSSLKDIIKNDNPKCRDHFTPKKKYCNDNLKMTTLEMQNLRFVPVPPTRTRQKKQHLSR